MCAGLQYGTAEGCLVTEWQDLLQVLLGGFFHLKALAPACGMDE